MTTAEAMPPSLPPAYRLVALDSVGSTNDEARRLAAEGAEDGTLVWAREQTAGRGRRGAAWTSPRGNLYLSLILRPDCPAPEALQLGFLTAVALGDALGSVVPPLSEVHFKWPNDLLLNGRKVSGILLESSTSGGGALDWLIVGLGVNIADFPRDTPFPATSLRAEACAASDVEMLEAFARHFLVWVNRWLEDGFAPVRRAWLAHAWRKGETIEVRTGKETLSGTFLDLAEDGALVLRVAGGTERRIPYGDVFPGSA